MCPKHQQGSRLVPLSHQSEYIPDRSYSSCLTTTSKVLLAAAPVALPAAGLAPPSICSYWSATAMSLCYDAVAAGMTIDALEL